MTALDPRARRAERLREMVLWKVSVGPCTFREVVSDVRSRSLEFVDDRAVDRALQVLRRDGRVRYRSRAWELAEVSS